MLAGATALKGWRGQQRPRLGTRPLATGAGAAFASTLAAARGDRARAAPAAVAVGARGASVLAAAVLAVRHNRAR